jgi:hypothetical protein
MKIDPDSIQEGVHDAFSKWLHPDNLDGSIQEGIREAFNDWMLNHEISFTQLVENAVERAFDAWLLDHSTEIIAVIAKFYADLHPESASRR